MSSINTEMQDHEGEWWVKKAKLILSEERIRLLEQEREKGLRLLRWWADRSMKTSSLTADGITSQIARRLATETFLDMDEEESNPAPSGTGEASLDHSPGRP